LITLESALIAAAAVGIIHMSAPDHWATLVVLRNGAKWTRRRLIGVSLVTSTGHVSFSVFLGLAIVEVAIFFSNFLSYYFTKAIGLAMLASGLYVAARAVSAKEEDCSDRAKPSGGPEAKLMKSAGYFAILGAALSPDLSILPVFLVAVPLGLSGMLETVLIFAISSILTAILFVSVFSTAFTKAVNKLPSKYNDALVGLVIAAVGVYVLILG
jgi:hypothetical protein